jgi:hypothetical protein
MPECVASFYVSISEPSPPSINKMYSTGRQGQRFLTKEGAKFKAALTQIVAQEIAPLSWKDAIEEVYLRRGFVRATVGVHTNLYNGSWKPGAKTKGGDMQSPYQKIDDLNYAKIVLDAVAEATGIDDSCNLESTSRKIDGRKMIEVFYEVMRRDPT